MEVQLIPKQERILKVAAYCRVSTAKAYQHESFETQCRYYTRFIESNPKWISAGIYADEGLSATTTAHRKGFIRMMEGARNGQIDLILVKSVSRFSRNAVDCNKVVQELKALQVEVRFEKENISTFDPTAEFLFNISAIVAQEVSHSLSISIRWRIQKDFEKGKHRLGNNMVFGFDVVDKQLVPNKDAWIIKRIFDSYLSGKTYKAICDELTALGVKGMRGAQISASTISSVLRNPIYAGDLQIQKQAPIDYLTKKPMNVDYKTYYITDDHEGIVSREVWEMTQERLNQRRKNKYPHFLDGKVFCGHCGEPYKRVLYSPKARDKYFSWECRDKVKGNTRGNGCKNPGIREKRLIEDLCCALNTDTEGLKAEADVRLERVVMANRAVDVVLKQ
ncbi:MAG: recombinase family protein [Clostridiales bacterium]|nr:recombinase family protein [Clostridiales bacterium]